MTSFSDSAGTPDGASLRSKPTYAFPASFGQARFWALDQQNPGNPTWNLPVRFRLEGPLEVDLLERAFNEIVRRHEVLRSTLAVTAGELFQLVADESPIELQVIDLSHLEPTERQTEGDRLSLEEARHRFDLSRGPLLRVGLIKLADNDHMLLVTPHHVIADYWSIGLISDELGALYEAYSNGLSPTLPEPPVQYGDYAVWQREQAQSAQVQSELAWWKDQLQNLPLLDFPTDRPRPSFPTYDATITSQLLPIQLTESLQTIAMTQGATFFNLMLAGLNVVLHQYSGQVEFGVGTQVAGRSSVEVEKLIGMFINTAVLRADLSANPLFPDLVARVRETGAQVLSRQNLRFEQLLAEVRPLDYPSHHSLFRVNFICQRDPVKPLEFAGIKLTVIPSKSQGALYDLNVFLILRNEGWRLACEYNTDLFEAETITRFLANYEAVLRAIVANPNRRLDEFPRPALSLHNSAAVAPAAAIPEPPPRGGPSALVELTDAAADETAAAPIANGRPGSIANSIANPAAPADAPLILTNEARIDLDADESCVFDTSLEQRSFWRLDQLMPGNPGLNLQAVTRLRGPLDRSLLARSLDDLIRRHEILRTSFGMRDGRVVQLVHRTFAVDLAELRMPAEDASDREAAVQRILRAEATRSFDLSVIPLLRASLLQLAPEDHLLIITTPPIICDARSDTILIRELAASYEDYSAERPSPRRPVLKQYADYACEQKRRLNSADLREDLGFWKSRFSDGLPWLELSIDRPPSSQMVADAGTETLAFPPELLIAVRNFCGRAEIAPSILFLAAFKTLLSRYTDADDIVVGTPAAARTSDNADVLGPFSYPILLRTDLSGEPNFHELLRRVREVVAQAHQSLPFERLLEELDSGYFTGRNSAFQFYFLYADELAQPLRTGALEWAPLTRFSPGTISDLQLSVTERSDELLVTINYKKPSYEAGTIRRMLEDLRAIIAAAHDHPEVKISELMLPSVASISRAPENPQSKDLYGGSIVERLEYHARHRPDAISACSIEGELKFKELNRRAAELAGRLAAFAGPIENEGGEPPVPAGRIIALCCDFSLNLLIGLCAALKARTAYLWFQPERLEDPAFMRLLQTHSTIVVTDPKFETQLRAAGLSTLLFDHDQPAPGPQAFCPASNAIGLEEVAAMRCARLRDGGFQLVSISHRALIARANSAADAIGLVDTDRIALIKSEASEDLLSAILWCGAAAVFVPSEVAGSDPGWLEVIEKQRCSVALLPTRRLQGMVWRCRQKGSKFSRGPRLILTYGERPRAMSMIAFAGVTGGAVEWACLYGTAESGTVTAVYRPRLDASASEQLVFLGTPAPGVTITLRDRHLRPVPCGVPGEICIESAGLALSGLDDRGAAGRSLVKTSQGYLSRSGEFGRAWPDGAIEYLGHPDDQLKLRGFVFHPTELEAALSRDPAIADVAVVPARQQSGDQFPVIHAVVREEVAGPRSAERDFNLRQRLYELAARQAPNYPKLHAVVFTDWLYRFEDGCLDRAHLAPCGPEAFYLNPETRPRDPLEAQLLAIWEELLGVKPIGMTDNFFELGGGPTLATRLLERIHSATGESLPLSSLAAAPTIAALAGLLRNGSPGPRSSTIVPIRAGGNRPPLYVVSGLREKWLRFVGLAYRLDDQPVYSLQPPRPEASEPCPTRIEDMASHYVRELKRIQPQGPYYLAGYAFGGLITFEMAHQLSAGGDEIRLLAMIEAPEWDYLCRRTRQVSWQTKRLRSSGVIATILFSRGRFDYQWQRVRRVVSNVIFAAWTKFRRPLPPQFRDLDAIRMFAAGRYRPRLYRGNLSVFRTRQVPSTPIDDDTLGWQALVEGLIEVYEVPSNHADITAEPNVSILAGQLNIAVSMAQNQASEASVLVPRDWPSRASAVDAARATEPAPVLLYNVATEC